MDAHSVLVFRQVARTGSMTAAAAALGWTQPAVSQHVRRLERALGTALLLRHGRTTRLTEAGEVLARHAESVAASLAVAEREVADLVGRRAGRVRLHAFSSALATLVPAALALLAARHPGIDARTIEALPPQAEAAVRDGTCDLALVFGYDAEPAHADLDVVPLRTEPLYAVLPAGHPLAGCDEVTVARLAAAAGFTLDVRHTTDDYLVAQGLVAAGLGVTLLPAPSLAAVRHPGVVAVPLRGERFHVRVLVRPQTARVPAVQALLEALRAAAAT
jgi:DNA-binding transcriptional LysR family regulator